MFLSNQLVYGNRLRCGTPAVAASMLALPHPERIPEVVREHSGVKRFS